MADGQQPIREVKKISLLIGLRNDANDPAGDRQNVIDTVVKLGGNVTHAFQIVDALAVELPPEALAAVARLPAVRVMEPDSQIRVNAEEVPWGIDRIDAIYNPADGKDEYTGGRGVIVAVIDTGIDLDHPDLEENIYTNSLELWGVPGVDDDGNGFIDDVHGWNFVANSNNPDDDHGHGSHCAGTVGAVGDNKLGVVGVAPGVTLMPIKVLDSSGSGSFSDVMAALDYCVMMGVNVTSNSYGSPDEEGTLVGESFDAAKAAGILHIASAGNSGNSSGTGDRVEFPGRYDSVIAVAATNINDTRASFSSTGPDVAISAPGVNVRSTYKNGGYRNLSGTSMACPHVAGAAAVLMADGVADIDIIVMMLGMTAVDLGPTGDDNLYGMGRIDLLEARRLRGSLTKPGATQTVSIASIQYGVARQGRDLTLEVKAVQPYADGSNLAVADAEVSITLLHVGSNTAYVGQATTDSLGSITFKLRGAPAGTYTTTINQVTAPPLNWDGNTPTNSFDF